jgi:hypothetical protein
MEGLRFVENPAYQRRSGGHHDNNNPVLILSSTLCTGGAENHNPLQDDAKPWYQLLNVGMEVGPTGAQ